MSRASLHSAGLVPACLALAGLLALAPLAMAGAQTHRVDDSASQVLGGTLRLKPVALFAHDGRANQLAGVTGVLVRLDVSPWKGRQARIFMTLPQQPETAITASWTTRGRLMPGVLHSGERALVYAGPIMDDTLEDTLRLEIQADGRQLGRDPQVAFAFEIDLDMP